MLKFRNRNETPPGNFKIYVEESKMWIERITWNDMVFAVKNHYKANNIPVGLQFEEWLEHHCCQNTSPEVCVEEGHGAVAPFRESRTLTEILTGTKTIVEWWLKEGKAVVPEAESEARAAKCIQCHFNQPIRDCPSCSSQKLDDFIVWLGGQKPTRYDSGLRGCQICGCALRLKVHIPLAVLTKNEPQHVKDQYPDWCWLKEA